MNKNYWLVLISLIALFMSPTAFAKVKMADGSYRPTVALVLAGGGAKGAAHIGVLKYLEEMRIPVDIVTGTSMGSYVGALYSLGYTAQEVEDITNSIDWNSGYQDRVDRSERRTRDKEYNDRYQIHTDLGVEFGSVKMPTGVVQGQNMLKLLRQSTGNIPAFDSFDDMAITYRAVATDLEKLTPVIMGDGKLVDAMMASMSVPGALQPYQYQGKILVDGGVTNNMPVDIAKALGADIVIAVDISTEYSTAEDLENIFGVASQLVNYLVRRSTDDQKKLLDLEKDVLLSPEVGKMDTTAFDQMPEANRLGYQAAEASKNALSRYSISKTNYQAYQARKKSINAQIKQKQSRTIRHVKLINDSHYNQDLLVNRLGIEEGEKYSNNEVEAKIHNLYALDRFELVSYDYIDNDDGTQDIEINVKEKSWGPNYLDFRFAMEDNFQNSNKYSIGFTANYTGLSDNGAELRTNVEIGTDKLFGLELYYPLSYDQEFFVSTQALYSKERSNVFFDPNSDMTRSNALVSNTNNSIAMDYREWKIDTSLGYQRDLWQEFRLGMRYTHGTNEFSGLSYAGGSRYDRYGVYASYQADTLDDYYLPNKGFLINAEYLASLDRVKQSGSNYEDIVFEFNTELLYAHSYQKHTVVGKFEYGLVNSEESFYPLDPQSLGGFLNLSGIPRDSLSGRNKAYGSLVYRYRWFDNDFGLFSSPVYIGASAEYGGVWSDTNNFNRDAMYLASSLFVGIRTPVGPIFLGYGMTEEGLHSGYLIIGPTF